jgi:hypothetical protein
VISLPLGTIENLQVDVEDRKNNLTTLDGTGLNFSVRPRFGDDMSWVIENDSASNDGLRAFCLIDTTDWDVGEYEMYIQFDNLPEIPKLGPMHFEVI